YNQLPIQANCRAFFLLRRHQKSANLQNSAIANRPFQQQNPPTVNENEFRLRGRMSRNHRPAFGSEGPEKHKYARESRAWTIGVAVIGLLGIVSTITLAQSNGQWFRAHDPGPLPNPQSHIPNPVPGLNENEAALFNESLLRVSELEGSCD